ncbi:MAG: hypothetical protein AB1476_06180, partial [Candidatus Hadarchaeota archaeon]
LSYERVVKFGDALKINKRASNPERVSLADIFLEPKNQKLVIYMPPTVKRLLEQMAKDSNVTTNKCVLHIVMKQLEESRYIK